MQAIERVRGDVLQHVRLGSGPQRARDVLVGVVGRQDDDLGLRVAFANTPHGFDAFHHRHAEIEERDVRPMPIEGRDGLDAIGGFCDDAQVRFLIDDVGDAGAEERVIVHDEHARGHRVDRSRAPLATALRSDDIPGSAGRRWLPGQHDLGAAREAR